MIVFDVLCHNSAIKFLLLCHNVKSILNDMATVQWVIMKHHKRDDGTYNAKILLTHNRKRAYMPTTIYTSMVRFKRGSFFATLTDKTIEDTLNAKVAKIRSIINEYEEVINNMATASEVRDLINHTLGSSKSIDFLAFAKKHISSIPNDNTRYYHESRLRTFASFIKETKKTDVLPVTEINSKLVKDYSAWLKASKRRRGEGYGISDNTIRTYVFALATLFNAAKERYNDYDNGVIVIKAEPFRTYKQEKTETAKRALSAEEIKSIWEYTPTNKSAEIARDVFLLSFFLAGMNVADMWECQPFTDRIEYTRKKTRSHKKDAPFLSLPIHPRISPIVEKYADINGKRGFGFYNSYSKIGSLHQCIHYGMLRMREDLGLEGLTFYAARHSFATIARNDCGVSMDDIALCLTHDSGHSMTDTYIKKDYSRIDNVIDKVVQFVFGE